MYIEDNLPVSVSDLINDEGFINDSEGLSIATNAIDNHNNDISAHDNIRQVVDESAAAIASIQNIIPNLASIAYVKDLYKPGAGVMISEDTDGRLIISETYNEVLIPFTEWIAESSEGYPYINTVTLQGLTPNSNPVINVKIPNDASRDDVRDILEQWDKIYSFVCDYDTITFYAIDDVLFNLSVAVKGY